MGEIGKKVIEKIKEEKIAPKPRWHFLLKNYFTWIFFVISVIIGSLAFCTILYVFFNNDWDLYKYLHTSVVGHIMLSIPYLWILFLALFTVLAYYNYKHTRDGYRHEAYMVMFLSIAGSALLGTFLYTLGAGEVVEDVAVGAVPYYEKITCCNHRKDIWDQPTIGLLGGEIIQIIDNKNFELKDFGGSIWQVQEDEDTLEFEPLKMKVGEEVKVIGEEKKENFFWAREVRPWKNKGKARPVKSRIED
jgi:heme/copper-type cytochrome/quinol oxidase subunit 2